MNTVSQGNSASMRISVHVCACMYGHMCTRVHTYALFSALVTPKYRTFTMPFPNTVNREIFAVEKFS